MANRFYSCEFGADKVAVVETATTTAAADVEVRVTYDATNNSKLGLLLALENIRAKILADTWPPA